MEYTIGVPDQHGDNDISLKKTTTKHFVFKLKNSLTKVCYLSGSSITSRSTLDFSTLCFNIDIGL